MGIFKSAVVPSFTWMDSLFQTSEISNAPAIAQTWDGNRRTSCTRRDCKGFIF